MLKVHFSVGNMRFLSPMILTILPAALLATASSSGARNDDHERRDAVRRANEAGEVLPLSEILRRVRGQVAGDIAGIDVEHEHGRWRYEFRVIDRAGRVLEVVVDARTGAVEQIEER
jgi:uncharacterized membrane protein YkoI